MPKKSKKPKKKKRKISAREFNKKFTKIIAGHLSTLSPEEQDRRIRAAERVATTRSRGASATTRGAAETQQIRLAARTP